MAAEPDDTNFVSKLSEESKKKAKDELNEINDKDRLIAVQTFRQWVLEQKWLKTPTDFAFLLRFLRIRKFSQLEARKRLEHYWATRSKRSLWFKGVDVTDPLVLKIVKMGVVISPTKLDPSNRRVIIGSFGRTDLAFLKEIGMDTFYKALFTVYDWLCTDENVQVNGVVILSDYSGMTMQQFTSIWNAERQKDLMGYFQNGLPIRMKSLNIYNEPAFFDFIYNLASPVMSQKIKSRLRVHGKSLVNVYKEIGYECLPDEYLPDDYEGPRIGSYSDIIENMIQEMTKSDVRKHIADLSSDKYGIDKSRMAELSSQETASYRKLNVD